jgi:hypothetical protein
MKVLAITPNREARVYRSTTTAARQLSGDGTTRTQRTIQRRIAEGGGYIGNVWIQGTAFGA